MGEDDYDINDDGIVLPYGVANSHLYTFLISKTVGEARTIVNTVESSPVPQGLLAWKKLSLHFGRTTSRELSLEQHRLMNPTPSRNLAELGASLEKWVGDTMKLNNQTAVFSINEGMMRTTLVESLCSKIPELQKELRMKNDTFKDFEEMRKFAVAYARSSRADPNAMDCSMVARGSDGTAEPVG